MSGSVLRGVGMQSFDDWDGEEEEFFLMIFLIKDTCIIPSSICVQDPDDTGTY